MKDIEYSLICKVYLEGDIAVKNPIIGLIFPEKLEFDGIINFGLQIKEEITYCNTTRFVALYRYPCLTKES